MKKTIPGTQIPDEILAAARDNVQKLLDCYFALAFENLYNSNLSEFSQAFSHPQHLTPRQAARLSVNFGLSEKKVKNGKVVVEPTKLGAALRKASTLQSRSNNGCKKIWRCLRSIFAIEGFPYHYTAKKDAKYRSGKEFHRPALITVDKEYFIALLRGPDFADVKKPRSRRYTKRQHSIIELLFKPENDETIETPKTPKAPKPIQQKPIAVETTAAPLMQPQQPVLVEAPEKDTHEMTAEEVMNDIDDDCLFDGVDNDSSFDIDKKILDTLEKIKCAHGPSENEESTNEKNEEKAEEDQEDQTIRQEQDE